MLLLSHNGIETEGAQSFADYFRTYDSLRSLSVSSASMDFEGLKILLESLHSSAESGNLNVLDISENMCTDKKTIDSLCRLIKSAKHLTSLNISDLGIDKGKD